ncbi:MAG: plasmid stabilization protein [Rhodobacteraceae bacterium]|nr:plasmid stabilization protein [Paracoccaceae bacterium]MAY47716.1 plasmid stabilization protein [Paracoccaceae bacterium]|tara:strand:- start:542 stop:874 length:333 start_codon:yes stop_codon:yes gene_type:complete
MAAESDFAQIFDHLAESYIAFGEESDEALIHAARCIRQIRGDADRLLVAPHRGQSQGDLLPESGPMSFGQASCRFILNDEQEVVTVLAIFHGGQDARRRRLLRALSQEPD